MHEVEEILGKVADEHADLLDLNRHSTHNLTYSFWCDVSRALLIKHESQGVCAGFDRRQRILEICNPANLYPGHKTQFSVQSPVLRSLLTSDQRMRLALRFRQKRFQRFSGRLLFHQRFTNQERLIPDRTQM